MGRTIPRACARGYHDKAPTALQVFVAHWAKRLSWKQTVEVFGVSWSAVFRAVQTVVAYGLAQGNCGGFERQGQTGLQKSLRLPDLSSRRSLAVSSTWAPTRTKTHPLILLRRLL